MHIRVVAVVGPRHLGGIVETVVGWSFDRRRLCPAVVPRRCRVGLLIGLGRLLNGPVVEWLVLGDVRQSMVWRDLGFWC